MAPTAEAVKPLLVVPMTGISSRFTAAGYDLPKFLLEVDGQSVLDHVIDMYPGWADVLFICNPVHLDDPRLQLRERLLARRPGATVFRARGKGDGPGAVVLEAREHIPLDRPVVVNYCDFSVYWDPEILADRLASGEVDGVIPVYSGHHPHMAHSTSYAYMRMEGTKVVDIQEKQPWTDDPHSEFASSGTYAFASGKLLLDSLEQQVAGALQYNGEYYLSLTYKPLLARGGRVEVLAVQHFMQWGTPQDFEEYRDMSRALDAWTRPRVTTGAGTAGARPDAARVVLASGAGQRFKDAGYAVPKPALPISGRTVIEHALAGVPGEETVVVTRDGLEDSGAVVALAAQVGARIVSLPGLTRGQAESALRGLERVQGNGPVTVAACDALASVSQAAFDEAIEAAGPNGVIPWLARPFHGAARNPTKYGWAEIDESGQVRQVSLKAAPGSTGWGLMIGTFSFGSRDGAIRQIEQLIDDDDRVNGEFYLDSLVARAVAAGSGAVGLVVDAFVSVGTPDEYQAVLYWQSCFHKWSHHRYALAADPLVPAHVRAELDREFRAFEPLLSTPSES